MEPRPDTLEPLLETTRWVRALGVELAGASGAEDLVQDAWVLALERGDSIRNPAAWVSGVVRRLARRSRRGETRRARRERESARPEAQPGPDALLAEAELSQTLLRAVTELDEPFRSTVLLRYLHDQTPESIAAAQGIPAATVRSRLHRALARLRERLDRENGGREHWVPAFIGAGILSGSSAAIQVVTAGGWLVGTKGLIGGGVLLASLVLWLSRATPEEGKVEGRGERALAALSPGDLQGGASAAFPAPGARRDPVVEPATSVAEVLLHGSVSGADGAPLDFESFTLEDVRGLVSEIRPAMPGVYAIAGLAPGTYELRVRAAGHLPFAERLVVRDDADFQRHDVVLAAARSISVRLLDETGALYKETPEEIRTGLRLEVVVTREAQMGGCWQRGRRPSLGTFRGQGAGISEVSGHLDLLGEPPLFAHVLFGESTLATLPIEPDTSELVFHLSRAERDSRSGSVHVRFVDADRQVPEDLRAALDPPNLYSGGEAPGEDGSFLFGSRSPGWLHLRVMHRELATAERWIRVPEGDLVDLGEIRLSPKVRLSGHVHDAAGRTRGFSVDWRPASGDESIPFSQSSTFRAPGGRFSIDVPGDGPLWLRVRGESAPTLLRLDPVTAASASLDIALDDGVPVRFQVGPSAIGRELRLFDSAGVLVEDRLPGSVRLASGAYEVRIGCDMAVQDVRSFVVGDAPTAIVLGEGESDGMETATATPDSEPTSGGLVYGRVLDSVDSSSPPSPIAIEVVNAFGTRYWTRATLGGAYALAGLTPGDWTLRWKGSGFLEREEALVLTDVEPLVRQDILPERCPTLAIRALTDEGLSIAEAIPASVLYPRAVATLESPGPTIEGGRPEVGTMIQYGALFESAPVGTIAVLALDEDRPVHVSLVVGSRVVATRLVESIQGEVLFRIDVDALRDQQASVTVRAVDEETGELLDGAVWVDQDTMNSMKGGHWSSTLAPGPHDLMVHSFGLEALRQRVDLSPGESLELDLRLPPERTIEGRLLDPDGHPRAAEFTVSRRLPDGRLVDEDEFIHRSHPDGRFEIHALGAGEYVFRTSTDESFGPPPRTPDGTLLVSPNVSVGTRGGSVTGLEVHLVPAGTLVVQGLPETATLGDLRDANGDRMRLQALRGGPENGFQVPPGAYTLVVLDESWTEIDRRPVMVGSGRTVLDLSR